MKFIVKCHKRTVVVAVSRTHITIWYNMTLIHSFLNESVSYCIILWCVFLKQQQQPGEVTGFQVLLDSLHPRTTTVFLFLAFPDFQCGLGLPEANLGYFRRRFFQTRCRLHAKPTVLLHWNMAIEHMFWKHFHKKTHELCYDILH